MEIYINLFRNEKQLLKTKRSLYLAKFFKVFNLFIPKKYCLEI